MEGRETGRQCMLLLGVTQTSSQQRSQWLLLEEECQETTGLVRKPRRYFRKQEEQAVTAHTPRKPTVAASKPTVVTEGRQWTDANSWNRPTGTAEMGLRDKIMFCNLATMRGKELELV